MLPVILHIGGSKISGHEFGISGAQIEWAVEHMGRSEGRPLNLYLCKENNLLIPKCAFYIVFWLLSHTVRTIYLILTLQSF